jgi:hypothetical protein
MKFIQHKYIQHEAFVNLYNKDQKLFFNLFKGVGTISTLSNRINKLSKDFENHNYPDEDKMKGDLFEIFTEAFFKILSADNRIAVYNYQPALASDDYGVDGFGIGNDNKPLTVQSKFRSDVTKELLEKDIKQFAFQSIVNYDVDKNTSTNMIVFTNAKGLHWVTESRVFAGRIRCIGYEQIKSIINGNTVFWKEVIDTINNTILYKYNNKK